MPSGQFSAESREYLPRENLFLRRVHLVHRLEDREDAAGFLRRADQRFHVFRETGAAVTRAGVQEVKAYARVRSDASAHFLDIRAEALGEVGELVHERDARRKHRVRRVLGELSRTYIHQEKAVVVALERSVK